MATRTYKILYAAGPGNVIQTYRHWSTGEDDPTQVAMTYSGQFFDLCRELPAEGYIVSSHPERNLIRDGRFTLEHLPRVLPRARHVWYHLSRIGYGLLIVWRALRFRADAAVIAEGTTHWFALYPLTLARVKVIPALHCVLWPKYGAPGKAQRLINRLDRRFFRKEAWAILSASGDIADQVVELTGGSTRPIHEFLPTYRRETFADLRQPVHDARPFRVLFAGRVERDKGVFSLLEIARRFASEGHHDIGFDLCGEGSAMAELRADAAQAAESEPGLKESFRIHGYCLRPRLREMLEQAHVVIVPTTTDFIEGFNQVVVEAVLAGRPVITSSVCPALNYVRDAVVEVPPEDTDGYAQAILALRNDSGLYREKREACSEYQSMFYDAERGWGAALRRSLRACE
jgi:glycosyltransferase involved in cell wall biosynthesis